MKRMCTCRRSVLIGKWFVIILRLVIFEEGDQRMALALSAIFTTVGLIVHTAVKMSFTVNEWEVHL
jgi:hypothetical protein